MNWWASLRLSLICLVALALWMGAGVVGALIPDWAQSMHLLDSGSLLDWFSGPYADHPLLNGWLAGLFALVGLLLTNLGLCIYDRLWAPARRRNPRALLSLVLHLLVLVTILLQGSAFFLLEIKSRVRLHPGQTTPVGDGLVLRLDQVHYSADPALLKLKGMEAHKSMTREAFDRHSNWAEMSLLGPDGVVASGNVFHFHPLEYDGWRVFLLGFLPGTSQDEGAFGVKLNLVRSPLWVTFALVYLALLAVAACLVGWRASNGGNNSKKLARRNS